MNIHSIHQEKGGTIIETLNVQGDLNVYGEGLASAIKENADGTDVESMPVVSPVDGTAMYELVRKAAMKVLFLKDDNNRDIFHFTYMWQSVYRILRDANLVDNYTTFTKLIQNVFPQEELDKLGKGKLYLTDPTNFSQKDCGMYADKFGKWKEREDTTGGIDPRYTIAKVFKSAFENLRAEQVKKQEPIK